ncbi:MAG TPA: hypothetical protein VM100_04720 [Longimicrobiales bacterium]|nr:hypothetical protein [Longimicrobiales bacterium]
MKFKLYSLLAVAAVAGMTACSSDVTSEGSGTPEALVTSRTLTNQTKGSKFSITAYAVDKNLQRMPGALEATSANSGTVVIDSVRYFHELLETRIFINAANTSTAGTVVTVKGHGLSKDVTVKIT